MSIGVFDIDEGLDNYFKTLDDNDRNWSLTEESNARDILGMNILTDETVKNLQTTTQGKSHMKGTHCYTSWRMNCTSTTSSISLLALRIETCSSRTMTSITAMMVLRAI